jgi:hypothetical protein
MHESAEFHLVPICDFNHKSAGLFIENLQVSEDSKGYGSKYILQSFYSGKIPLILTPAWKKLSGKHHGPAALPSEKKPPGYIE